MKLTKYCRSYQKTIQWVNREVKKNKILWKFSWAFLFFFFVLLDLMWTWVRWEQIVLSFFFCCNQILCICSLPPLGEKERMNDQHYERSVMISYHLRNLPDFNLSRFMSINNNNTTTNFGQVGYLLAFFLSLFFINTNCFVLNAIGNIYIYKKRRKTRKEKKKKRWALLLTRICMHERVCVCMSLDGKEWTKGDYKGKKKRRGDTMYNDREKCRPYHIHTYSNNDIELNLVSLYRGLCI